MPLNILLAQINTHVGDFDGNVSKILAQVEIAEQTPSPSLLVFPELTVCGYPPEDLLLRPSMSRRVEDALQVVAAATSSCYALVGYPRSIDGKLYNMAGVIHAGGLIAEYAKHSLPNYQVFDERRYFASGDKPCVVDVNGTGVGITICEDIWVPEPAQMAKSAGAELLVNMNSSPFHRGKQAEREAVVKRRATEHTMPVIYVNQVGGQDELVFDGGSFAVEASGELVFRAPQYEEGIYQLVIDQRRILPSATIAEPVSDLPGIYQALVLGVRDYVNKNGFRGVVLGLSGGIDSAVTLAVAVDALGPDRVEAVMMPFRYTSQASVEDAAEQSDTLGVSHKVISIESVYESFMASLKAEFEGTGRDTTEENLQARCRGVLLMSISNKKGYLVLTTGNKSEMAVGYSTLYGDMAGGFDVLKDVPKTVVFDLARYRNSLGANIPQRVIDRPPSAELAPDQKDEDSLPPYEVLDRILELYVEHDLSAEAIIAEGVEREQVERVLRLVDLNEYKRRQAPIGVRITQRGFGRDRRYPITSAWKIGH